MEVVGDRMSSENWPSSTDCLRAWGWFEAKGRESVRARGEGTSGDVGADFRVSLSKKIRSVTTHCVVRHEKKISAYTAQMTL